MSESVNQTRPAPAPANAWDRLRLVVLVPLARLRFVFVLVAIGAVIVKWDYLADRWQRWFGSKDAAAAGDVEYFCPMHPTIVRDTNKEKCPVCAMPLSKRKKGSADGADEALAPGTVSRVQLTPYRVVLAGVRTEPVAYQPLTRDINVVGSVEFDERGLKNVSARVKGRIEKLFVNQTGQLVKEREPLASVYSPELAVTVENLLSARKANNPEGERNAAERLRLWGIDDEEIEKIVKDGKPVTNLTVRSPIKGDAHVIRKYVREGQYVEEGAPLYDVADISTVWVQAQLYEDDLAFLPKGAHDPETGKATQKLKVTATTRAFPGREFEGTLSFVFPHLDPESRTLTARFELDNKGHELRPGMVAAVTLKLDPASLAEAPAGQRLIRQGDKVLAVPERAVIDTGAAKYVYREEVPNTFAGVPVELGARMTGPNREVYYPVLRPLADTPTPGRLGENDLVVASGSFLIDAETRLNHAAGSIYVGGSSGSKAGPAVKPTTPDDMGAKIAAAYNALPPAERKAATAQKTCPIQNEPLGSMGRIIKVDLEGKPVYLCCAACIKKAKENPAETLAAAKALSEKSKK